MYMYNGTYILIYIDYMYIFGGTLNTHTVGIPCTWIGVGLVIPFFFSDEIIDFGNFISYLWQRENEQIIYMYTYMLIYIQMYYGYYYKYVHDYMLIDIHMY